MSIPNSEKTNENVEQAAEDDKQASNGGIEASGEYVAPFYPSSGAPQGRNRYAVTFHKGHTLEKHWEAIGFRTGSAGPGSWYSSKLSDEQRERVRRDPGVKKVEQYGEVEWG